MARIQTNKSLKRKTEDRCQYIKNHEITRRKSEMKKLIASVALATLLVAVVLVGIASADRPKAASQEVVAVNPADGATGVDLGANVEATFDITMTNASSATFTLEGPSGAVTSTVTYSNATQTATLNPDADLDYATVYTATLSKDLSASTGITLGTDYVWSFTSRARMPVLAIAKTVTPTDDVELGSIVTYTVSIANNGDADATGVVITDNLPALVTFGGYVSNDGGTARLPGPAGTITWTNSVSVGASYSLVFTATVTSGTAFYGTDVTNVAYFTSTNAGSGHDDAVFTIEGGLYYIFLPLVTRNATGTAVLP
jgi:uncharacterized repeat protein (TIGR01451 family)